MRISRIETIPLQLEFIPDVDLSMRRATTHTGAVTLYRVQLDSGEVGYGDETGQPRDASAWEGTDAVLALRHCRHAGVQMACFDAVGRALGLPAHALMGRQVRARVPFAYWTIDLPPAVFARQVQHAAALGYTSYKFKCRPWWDPIEQVAAAAKVAPPGFRVWLDFNGHLRELRHALPILQRLTQFECVGGIESPIPQRDVEGYQTLRRKIDRPIVGHFGGGCCHVVSDRSYDQGAAGSTQLRADVFDGFVLGGSDVDHQRGLAATLHEFRKPFWFQNVGTALRAAWTAHLASTCQEALLSSLAAHDLWQDDVASAPRPTDGWLPVPDGPGLGIAPDEQKLTRLAAAPARPPERFVSTVVYPSGVRWSFADEQQRHEAFYFGDLPGFTPGIRLDVRQDDGSADFDDLHRRCAEAPVVT